MNEFDGIDPADIADLEARARRITDDAETFYRIVIEMTHDSAEDFLESYQDAVMGDIRSFARMMQYVNSLAYHIFLAVTDENEGL